MLKPQRFGSRLVALGLMAVVAVYAQQSGFLELFNDPFNDHDFDRNTWLRLRKSDDPDNPRGGMFSDIRDRLERDRPTREEVLALLGPTEFPCGQLTPELGPHASCLSYNLGMWSGMRLDYDTLDVYFSASGRVARVVHVQH